MSEKESANWVVLMIKAGICWKEQRKFARTQSSSNWKKAGTIKHRKCYQAYTNKILFDRLQNRHAESESFTTMACKEDGLRSESPLESESSCSSSKSMPAPQTEEVCIVCQTRKKKPGKEIKTLSKCRSFNPDKRVTKSAEKKKDQRILLAILCEDLVAKEVKYHKSCYEKYKRLQARIRW